MPIKVYAVTNGGEYSDYAMLAMFTDENLARQLVEALTPDVARTAAIEVWETLDAVPLMPTCWTVYAYADGGEETEVTSQREWRDPDDDRSLPAVYHGHGWWDPSRSGRFIGERQHRSYGLARGYDRDAVIAAAEQARDERGPVSPSWSPPGSW